MGAGYDIGVSSSSAFGAQFGPQNIQTGFRLGTAGWAVIAFALGVAAFVAVKIFGK